MPITSAMQPANAKTTCAPVGPTCTCTCISHGRTTEIKKPWPFHHSGLILWQIYSSINLYNPIILAKTIIRNIITSLTPIPGLFWQQNIEIALNWINPIHMQTKRHAIIGSWINMYEFAKELSCINKKTQLYIKSTLCSHDPNYFKKFILRCTFD